MVGDQKPQESEEILVCSAEICVELNTRCSIEQNHELEDKLVQLMLFDAVDFFENGNEVQLSTGGEIESYKIFYSVENLSDEVLSSIVKSLNEIGVPKKSRLMVEGEEYCKLGELEGIALYFSKNSVSGEEISSVLIDKYFTLLEEKLANEMSVASTLNRIDDAVFYYYGNSYDVMEMTIRSTLEKTQLFEQIRLKRIA